MENWLRDPWVTASPSARQIVSIFTRESGQKRLGHFKYAAILAVAFHLVKMKAIWPAALDGAPSGHPRTTSMPQITFSKKSLNLTTTFLELFCPLRRGHETP